MEKEKTLKGISERLETDKNEVLSAETPKLRIRDSGPFGNASTILSGSSTSRWKKVKTLMKSLNAFRKS
jgi:hypothetical protein